MSVEELDKIVELTLEDTHLVYGSHLSGGGFGGCVATLLHKDTVASTKERILVSLPLPLPPSLSPSPSQVYPPRHLFSLTIQKGYRSRDGKKATFVVCYPSSGAGVIDSTLLQAPSTET